GLMCVTGDLFEAFDKIGGVEAGARQRQVFASASIERGDALAVHRQALLSVTPTAHLREQLLQFLPVTLVELLELNGSHGQRRPRNHCATPRTRRVTSGPALPASPARGAAPAGAALCGSHAPRRLRAWPPPDLPVV